MDHGGEVARPTTVEITDLGMAGAVQGGEANIGSGTFDGELGAAAATPGSFSDFDLSGAHRNSAANARHVRRAVAGRGEVPVAAGFHFHRQPGQGVAYPNIGEFWQQLGLVDVALLGPHNLPDGVVPGHVNSGYSALQPRWGAGRGVMLVDPLPGNGGGAVYNRDYALLPRPGAGHGDVLVDLLPNGAGHGEVFVGLLSGGGGAAYDGYGYHALQPRPGAGHGEVLLDLLPHGAGHGEVLLNLLPGGGGGAVHDDYGYYPWQPRPGAGRGEVFIGPLRDGVGMVFEGLVNFAQQTLPGIGRADGIAGALRDPNLGAAYGGSGALADDLGAVYDNHGMVTEHLRRLLPLVGIGASSVAVNGLAAGPVSPAVAFHLFVLLLGGLILVMLQVLRG